ncbi:MAG: PfkB family carbohydrate kinase [bacterium]|nr:PfkB family carbohydrate kinase [bacterium]
MPPIGTSLNDNLLQYNKNNLNPVPTIAVICPNPAIDVTASSRSFALGDNVAGAATNMRAGGKGTNVACVAADLGAAPKLVAPLGGKTGAAFRDLLDPRVSLHEISVHGDTRLCLTLTSDGVITEIRGSGSAVSASEWEAFIVAAQEASASADATAICGSFPAESPVQWIQELIAAVTCPKVYVDTSGTHLAKAAECAGITIAPNFDELQSLCGDTLGNKEPVYPLVPPSDRPAHAAGLVSMQQQKTAGLQVLATLGEAGAGLLVEEQWHIAVPPEVHGNTVGAGDATLAAFSLAQVRGLSPSAALKYAVASGASAVVQPVAGHISPADVTRLESQTSLLSVAVDPAGTVG